MIDKALQFIQSELNARLRTGAGQEDAVVLASLSNPDNSVPLSIENKIVLSLVNIEKEAGMGSPPFVARSGAAYAMGNPSLFLNLYVLLSASFRNNYPNALAQLANAISFFQSRQHFDAQNSVDFPQQFERLSMELVSLSMDELSTLWAVLGANYLPSVVYKLRMLTIQGAWTVDAVAPVSAPHVQIGT